MRIAETINLVIMVDPDGHWAWLAAIWAGIKTAAVYVVKAVVTIAKAVWAGLKWLGSKVLNGIKGLGNKIKSLGSRISAKSAEKKALIEMHKELAMTSANESIAYYAAKGYDGVLIGNDMKLLHATARANNLGVIKGFTEYARYVDLYGKHFANKISLMYNKAWMKAVIQNNLKVFRLVQGNLFKGRWLRLELNILKKSNYPYQLLKL